MGDTAFLAVFAAALVLCFCFGSVYPIAEAFTSTFYVDLLVLGFSGFVLTHGMLSLGHAISFRLRLRRAMKELAP